VIVPVSNICLLLLLVPLTELRRGLLAIIIFPVVERAPRLVSERDTRMYEHR
jgi:hypothetical protein